MSSEVAGSMDAATAALINNLPEEFLPRRRPARACVAAAKQKLLEEEKEEREERLKAAREAKERAAAKKAARSAKKTERSQENLADFEERGLPDGPGVEDEDLSAGLDPEIYELRCMWELASILNFLNVSEFCELNFLNASDFCRLTRNRVRV